MKNQRNFLDEISATYKLNEPRDWKKLSSSLLKKKGGQVHIESRGEM